MDSMVSLRPGAGEDERLYFDFHRRRFEYLLALLRELAARLEREGRAPLRILDISVSMLTGMIRKAFPDARLATVGIMDPRVGSTDPHVEWDFNEAQDPDRWPRLGPFDIAVAAEVIEHLYTSPRLVLRCFASWLAPGGYLVLQTPNAASLAKRITLLCGRNPYEMIRDSRVHAGHFREYTLEELRRILHEVGLAVTGAEIRNYFNAPGWRSGLGRWITAALPATLREGITIVGRPAVGQALGLRRPLRPPSSVAG